VLVKRVVARIGERKTILVGLAIGWIGFAVFGLAPTGKIFLIGIPIMAAWSLCGPSAQGLMTRHVAHNEQGQLQGSVQCIRSLTNLIGPLIFTLVYYAALRPGSHLHLPGAPFLLASAILLSALPLAMVATKRREA